MDRQILRRDSSTQPAGVERAGEDVRRDAPLRLLTEIMDQYEDGNTYLQRYSSMLPEYFQSLLTPAKKASQLRSSNSRVPFFTDLKQILDLSPVAKPILPIVNPEVFTIARFFD